LLGLKNDALNLSNSTYDLYKNVDRLNREIRLMWAKNAISTGIYQTERVGFEPTLGEYPKVVFETTAFNRSAISPGGYGHHLYFTEIWLDSIANFLKIIVTMQHLYEYLTVFLQLLSYSWFFSCNDTLNISTMTNYDVTTSKRGKNDVR
jgi:hypothetical protein